MRARPNRASRFWEVAAADPCLLEPGASALDVGCGEGQLCDELRRWGWGAVVGVDVARTRIQRARQLYPAVQFYDVPLRHTDVAPETFDLIVMDNVLEHLRNPLESIRELRRSPDAARPVGPDHAQHGIGPLSAAAPPMDARARAARAHLPVHAFGFDATPVGRGLRRSDDRQLSPGWRTHFFDALPAGPR